MYTFLVFLFLVIGVMCETAIFYHVLGDKLAIPYRTVLLDILSVNMAGVVLLVLIFGPGVVTLDIPVSLQSDPRAGFFLIPDKILLLGGFTVISDAVLLTGLYYVRYPQLPWTWVALNGMAMNLPILLLMTATWMVRQILAEVFYYIRFTS